MAKLILKDTSKERSQIEIALAEFITSLDNFKKVADKAKETTVGVSAMNSFSEHATAKIEALQKYYNENIDTFKNNMKEIDKETVDVFDILNNVAAQLK